MRTSENIDQLVAALATAHLDIKSVPMTGHNPHFKTKFATLADISGAIREPLAKNGLTYVQPPSFFDGRVVITTRLAHKSGQWIETELSMKPQQDTPQALGSAITYGRRYALSALLGLAADEDDDGEAAQGRGEQKPKKIFDKNNQIAVQFLKKEMEKEGIDQGDFQSIIDQLHGKDYHTFFVPICDGIKKTYSSPNGR